MARVVLALDGSREALAAVPHLRRRGFDVITATMDFGEGSVLETARRGALEAGATRAHVLDVGNELVFEYLLPALQSGALNGVGRFRSLRAAVIARGIARIVAIEAAPFVACHGPQGDTASTRLELALGSLCPAASLLRLAREREAPSAPHTPVSPHPRQAPVPMSASVTGTRPLADVACVDLQFIRGVPVAVNGVTMPLPELVASLATIAHLATVRGSRSQSKRSVFWPTDDDPPVLRLLHAAHHAVQARLTDPEVAQVAAFAAVRYADLVDRGAWCSPLREALDAFVASVQRHVTGVARLRFVAGGFEMVDSTPCPPELVAAG